jgi:hypothetical protein
MAVGFKEIIHGHKIRGAKKGKPTMHRLRAHYRLLVKSDQRSRAQLSA